jgi:hypothetical protein
MSELNIAAEIIPLPGRAPAAARALQQAGFHVLRVDESAVSVQATEQTWKQTFDVSFTKERKERVEGVPRSSVEYAVPEGGPVRVPASLSGLVAEVLFVPPPQFF